MKTRVNEAINVGIRFGLLVQRHQRRAGLANLDVARLVYGKETRASSVSDIRNGRYEKVTPDTVARFRDALEIPQSEIDDLFVPELRNEPAEPSVIENNCLKEFNVSSPWVDERFIGRASELEFIRWTSTAADQVKLILIGTAGSGKTSLAQYSMTNGDIYDFDAKIWIRGDSPNIIIQDLVNLLRVSYDFLDNDIEFPTNETRTKKLVPLFNEVYGNQETFVVFDNVDELSTHNYFLQHILNNIKAKLLIVTSQIDKEWPIGTCQLVNIDTFSEHEALNYFSTYIGDDKEAQDARSKLAEDLGCLPLALALASSYMVKKRCSEEKYRSLWRKKKEELLAFETKRLSYPHSLEAAWDLATSQLSEHAAFIGYVVACFAPGTIPLQLFDDSRNMERVLGDYVPVQGICLHHALEELAEFSLIEWTTNTLSMNRVIRDIFSNYERKTYGNIPFGLAAAGVLLADSLPSPYDTKQVEVWKFLEPHLSAVCDRAILGPITGTQFSYICNEFGEWLSDQGDLGRACIYLDQALKHEILIGQGTTTKETATRLFNIAQICVRMGRIDDALEHCQRALELHIDFNGEIHESISKVLNQRAMIWMALEKWENAEKDLSKASAISEKLLGRNSTQMLCVLTNQSALWSERSNGILTEIILSKAEIPLLKAMEIIDSLTSDANCSVEIAQVYGMLGTIKFFQGAASESEVLLTKAYDMEVELHGKNHPSSIFRLGVLIKYSSNKNNAKIPEFLVKYTELEKSGLIYDSAKELDSFARYFNRRKNKDNQPIQESKE